jgi:hypothetical protein
LALMLVSACSSGSTESDKTTTAAASNSPTTAAASESNTQIVADAVQAANAFVSTLSDDAKKTAVLKYDDLDGKKSSWSNLPIGIFKDRQGAKLGDLDANQRKAALAVLDSLLSDQGMEQVDGILAADDYLGSSTGNTDWDSDNYWLAIYGEPSATSPWTVQFGGHHLAMHLTVGGGTVSVSPLFTGLEPTTFTVEGKQYSPMVGEADAVFGFLGSLSDAQLSAAKLSGTFDNVVMGPGADTDYPSGEGGIRFSELSSELQGKVRTIIKLWVGDADAALSDPLMEVYESQLADTVIGWSGSTDRTQKNAYLRIDGPRLWLEYLNVGGIGTTEIHYHTIYRDKSIDYGTGA